jgi:hypothetical protein
MLAVAAAEFKLGQQELYPACLESTYSSSFVGVGVWRRDSGRLIFPLFSNRYHKTVFNIAPSELILWNLESYSEGFKMKADNLNTAIG